MGYDLSCVVCEYQNKQCYSDRRELLNALRLYLKKNKEKDLELEYRYIECLYFGGEEITKKEENDAIRRLREKKLDGLFCYTHLKYDDEIDPLTAKRFQETYSIVKRYMKVEFYDILMIEHVLETNHTLKCW
jgi:hypothetical protein